MWISISSLNHIMQEKQGSVREGDIKEKYVDVTPASVQTIKFKGHRCFILTCQIITDYWLC